MYTCVLTKDVHQNLTDDGLSCIANCKRLVSLNLTWYVSYMGVHQNFILSKRTRFTYIRKLVSVNWQVCKSYWCGGLSNCPRLQVSWIAKVNIPFLLILAKKERRFLIRALLLLLQFVWNCWGDWQVSGGTLELLFKYANNSGCERLYWHQGIKRNHQ